MKNTKLYLVSSISVVQLLSNSLKTFFVKANRHHYGWCTEIKKVQCSHQSLGACLGKLAKQIFGKSWEFGPRRGGGSDPIPTFTNHCFYGIFDPFLPKISEKFTEKIPTFTENLFCMLPLFLFLRESSHSVQWICLVIPMVLYIPFTLSLSPKMPLECF